jgi:oligoribonuclease (3'-5' exoribonuclease)
MSKKKISYDVFVDKTVTNLDEDRDRALKIFNILKNQLNLATTVEEHVKLGAIAAKCVETMQRSNEQMLKVSGLLQRDHENEEEEDLDSEELFDLLAKEQNKEQDD